MDQMIGMRIHTENESYAMVKWKWNENFSYFSYVYWLLTTFKDTFRSIESKFTDHLSFDMFWHLQTGSTGNDMLSFTITSKLTLQSVKPLQCLIKSFPFTFNLYFWHNCMICHSDVCDIIQHISYDLYDLSHKQTRMKGNDIKSLGWYLPKPCVDSGI